MRPLIPHLISHSYHIHQLNGQFAAVSLFVDISGFTALTETLMQHQKDGAEILTAALNSIFQPLVEAIYARGGFITNFAGDAFTALFPYENHPETVILPVVQAAFFVQQFFQRHGTIETIYGTFHLNVKGGIGMGQAEWGILGEDLEDLAQPPSAEQAPASMRTFFFRGTAIDDCAHAEHYAERGELIASPPVRAFLAEYATATPIEQYLKLLTPRVSLGATSVPDLPPLNRELLHPFVLEAVLDLTASGVSGEFREAAVVFMSFDEPASYQALDAFATQVLRLTNSYGGYFNKMDFGDKGGVMLIVFGAPVTHENDLERAADFLLELSSQVPNVGAVNWRAGLTRGTVYAGFLGGHERSEYTVIGDVVNLAARLMMKASWGETWLSPVVARYLGARNYQTELLGDYTFKGKSAVTTVSRLIRRRTDFEAQIYTGELVGRATELDQLASWVEPLQRGQFAGITTIYGEAGMGKSRLAYALRQRLQRRQQIRWLLCPTDEVLRQSLNPFKSLLRGYFEQSSERSAEQNSTLFHRTLRGLAEDIGRTYPAIAQELARARPFLAALLDLPPADSVYDQMEPKLRFENTLLAIATLLRAESMQQPVVLQLEDLHWLDNDSLTLLTLLTRTLQNAPVAILATSRYRDDGSQVALTIDEDVPQQTIDLSTLQRAGVHQFAVQVLAGPVTDDLVQFLFEKTSGNPFFIEQLVLDLRERAVITPNDRGQWDIHQQDLVDVPVSINAVLIARLDRLPSEVRQIVQTASVLGREFAVPVLLRMLEDQDAILHQVASAEAERIWSMVGDVQLLFRHALLRDAAYDMQLRARLRELHALAGQAIADVFVAELPPHYADLAYHYGRAEYEQEERHYAGLAGEWAASRYANSEALTYLSRALELTTLDAVDDRYRLLFIREQVYDRQGQREQQAADLATLEMLARQSDNGQRPVEVSLRQASYANVTGDYGAAITAARRAIELTDAQQEALLRATGHLRWGFALWSQGDYPEAQEQLEQALELAHVTHLPRIEAESLFQLGKIAYLKGDYQAAQQVGQQSLQLYRELDDRLGQAQTLNHLGNIYRDQGEYEPAITFYQQALEMHRAMGDRYNEGVVLYNLSTYYWIQGKFDIAIEMCQEVLTICRAIHDQQGLGLALNNLGVFAIEQGKYTLASEYNHQALTIYEATGDQLGISEVLDGLGLLAHYQGDYAEAARYYRQRLTISQELQDQQNVGRALALLSLLAHHRGDNDAAYTYAQQALQTDQGGGKLYEEGSALVYLGHALEGLGDYTEAEDVYQQALTILREAEQDDQVTEARAGLARLALATGDLKQALAHVEPILEHLQSHPLLVGTDEPFRVYLSCYRVLQAAADPRATTLLQTGATLLQERARKIQDVRLRASFLERVPANQELLTAWQAAQQLHH